MGVDGRHLKNRQTAIFPQQFERSAHHLARCLTLKCKVVVIYYMYRKQQKSVGYDHCDVSDFVYTLTRQLTVMSHQFTSIRHSSYYLYRDVIYLDYAADENVISSLISLSSSY